MPAAMHRGLEAFEKLCNHAYSFKINNTIAIGTAALRRASNANEFKEKIFLATGVSIRIIDEKTEALFIAKGVLLTTSKVTGPFLILDIGGGSCEFIICNNNQILWSKSYEIGAALLLDKFKFEDPYLEKQVSQIEKYLYSTLQDFLDAIERFRPQSMVGSAGSFETFADLIEMEYRNRMCDNSSENYLFNLAEYKTLHRKLLQTTLPQKMEIPGMLKPRADMIAIASIITTFVFQKINGKQMFMSRNSLREGVLQHLAEGKKL
jgi:exopolyphosphatase/guanosine-5'-triphosphate,3'-diphosphate pyrophosphatase